jgi:outer membrane receptor for ferric coprogen and ferric-rhodotorulic acid
MRNTISTKPFASRNARMAAVLCASALTAPFAATPALAQSAEEGASEERVIIVTALSYDRDGAFFRLGANWMSKRYFTYTNDRSVDGRVIVDASLGYRFDDKTELQFNANNLFDEQYLSTINSGGTGNSGDRQTLLVGAPQQFFVTLKAGF